MRDPTRGTLAIRSASVFRIVQDDAGIWIEAVTSLDDGRAVQKRGDCDRRRHQKRPVPTAEKRKAYAPWHGKKPAKTRLTAREKTTALNGHNIRWYCAVLTKNMDTSQKRALRKAVLDATAYAQAANMTNRELQQLIAKKWSEYAGTTEDKFTDRSGRTWRDDVYLQMLVRTNLAALARAQQIKTLVENGRDLARVSDESADSCDACAEWSGKIVSLTGATEEYPTLAKAKSEGLSCVIQKLDNLIHFARDINI